MARFRLDHKLVWAFNALLVALATGTGIFAVISTKPQFVHNNPVPWIALVVFIAAAESCMSSITYRSDSQTFSLAELALCLGIAFVNPAEFVTAQILALFVVHHFRKSPPLRVAFNIANTSLSAVLAYLITSVLAPTGSPPARSWLAILASLLITSVGSVYTVAAVRSIFERQLQVRGNLGGLVFAMVNSVACGSMGLLAGIAIEHEPRLMPFAFVPIAIMYLSLRSLVDERTKRSNVEFLYETTKAVHRTADFEQALTDLLERARTVFRSEYAELAIRRPDTESWLRFAVGTIANPPADRDLNAAPVWLPPGQATTQLEGQNNHLEKEKRALLESIGARNAMVSTLRGDTGTEAELLGAFIVADRVASTSYEPQNVRLFDLLAAQVAVALENGHLERSLGQLTRLEQELRYQAHHDPLTGLANRAGLASAVESLPPTARAVLLIDLDDFKIINDSLGHDAGDLVLVEVAARLKQTIREGDVVARLGGDEFAVLLTNVRSAQDALETAERVSIALRPPISIGETEVFGRGSLGVAFGDNNETMFELMRNADVAMYESKRQGKGNFRSFEPGMDAAAKQRLVLSSGIRAGLDHDEFSVLYQPIFDLTTREITSVEAYVRWAHPDFGLIMPDEFLTIAEDSGMITEIGLAVLRKSALAVQDLRTPGGAPIRLSLNLSARQLREPRSVERMAAILKQVDFDPARLTFEITEATVFDKSKIVPESIAAIREIGASLALDNFGTGYGSVAALHNFPVNYVKIHKQFTQDVTTTRGSEFVRTILGIAATLNLTAIAEGIETDEQIEALVAIGGQFGQGYFLGLPVDEVGLRSHFAVDRTNVS